MPNSIKKMITGFMIALIISFSIQSLSLGQSREPLYSPTLAGSFYDLAYEIGNTENAAQQQIDESLLFIFAARNLDTRTDYVNADIIRFSCKYQRKEYYDNVKNALENYLSPGCDLEIVRKATSYLLEQLQSREQRQELIKDLLAYQGTKNDRYTSELNTLMGLMYAETADFETALSYFLRAYEADLYNDTAFLKIQELSQAGIDPAVSLEYLRRRLQVNPFDLDKASAFAQYTKQLQLYDTAAKSFEYCAQLYRYLNPDKPLIPEIYIPWTVSCYNSEHHQHTCLAIAEGLKKNKTFDIIAEAFAGKAATRTGNQKKGLTILKQTEAKALKAVSGRTVNDVNPTTVTYSDLAWFYCFTMTDKDQAIDWANKAYSTEPNNPTNASLLAYALMLNGQNELAKTLIENYEQNQIANLVRGQILLQEGQNEQAVEAFEAAIAVDPASLAGHQALKVLRDNNMEYVSPIDPDITLTALTETFGNLAVPSFTKPEERISAKLKFRGTKFAYGSDFGSDLIINNNSKEPIIIDDDGFLKGYVRIHAEITGDIEEKIPAVLSRKYRPSKLIQPQHSLSIPVKLYTGRLRDILVKHPQASLTLQFAAYLDPVEDKTGNLSNLLDSVKPIQASIERPKVNLSNKYIQNRFNSISKGKQGQKLVSVQLFSGLLQEYDAMAKSEAMYKYLYADWMPEMLNSALALTINDDNWIVSAQTLMYMNNLSLNYDLIKEISANINNPNWPVRFMALYLLAKNQGPDFKKVLDWTAQYDDHEALKEMAIILGGDRPIEEPTEAVVDPNVVVPDANDLNTGELMF